MANASSPCGASVTNYETYSGNCLCGYSIAMLIYQRVCRDDAMPWIVHLPSDSHHQDFYILVGSPYNLHLTLLLGKGATPTLYRYPLNHYVGSLFLCFIAGIPMNQQLLVWVLWTKTLQSHTQILNVWCIYLYVGSLWGKCRYSHRTVHWTFGVGVQHIINLFFPINTLAESNATQVV